MPLFLRHLRALAIHSFFGLSGIEPIPKRFLISRNISAILLFFGFLAITEKA
jgi:hypothetical protein